MTEEDRKDFGLFKENIRKKFQIEIENIGEKWEDKDIEDLSGWWKILFNKNSDRIEKEKLKQIEWCIERRCQMIDGEQGRMLASLLEKPFNHVVVDKLLENQNNIRVLTCDPGKVKEKTKEFFQNQFRRRCFNSDALGEEWAQVYAPLERVQEKWFEALDKDISEEEWEGMLKDLKRNTALGVSGITYTLIKAADSETQKVFRSFAGLCIQLGRIPTKWKVSQIYPIPKDANWGYDLGNVRPIALLETF